MTRFRTIMQIKLFGKLCDYKFEEMFKVSNSTSVCLSFGFIPLYIKLMFDENLID